LFELPTVNNRKEYLTKRLSPIVANIQNYDVDRLSLQTEGCTYEDLNKIVCSAFLKTRRKRKTLTQEDLEYTLNTEVRHIISENDVELTEREHKMVASHQAACALVSLLLESSDKLTCVTLKPVMQKIEEQTARDNLYAEKQKKIQHGQTFIYKDGKSLDIDPKENLLRICKRQLAGTIGEEIILGSSDYTYNIKNKEKAIDYLIKILAKGINKNRLPKNLKDKYFEEAIKLADQLESEVRQLLNKNKNHLKNIYNALIDQKTLYADQIKEIIKNGYLNKTTRNKESSQLAIQAG